jgi:hypothetical protein
VNARDYVEELNIHLSYLYSFARQMNELDFAVSSATARGHATSNGALDELRALRVEGTPRDAACGYPANLQEAAVVTVLQQPETLASIWAAA